MITRCAACIVGMAVLCPRCSLCFLTRCWMFICCLQLDSLNNSGQTACHCGAPNCRGVIEKSVCVTSVRDGDRHRHRHTQTHTHTHTHTHTQTQRHTHARAHTHRHTHTHTHTHTHSLSLSLWNRGEAQPLGMTGTRKCATSVVVMAHCCCVTLPAVPVHITRHALACPHQVTAGKTMMMTTMMSFGTAQLTRAPLCRPWAMRNGHLFSFCV